VTIGRIYIAGMLAFGLIAGLIIAAVPGLRDSAIPVFIWPLVLSLLVDIVLMPRAQAGQISPLTMTERGIGVIGSALIIIAIMALA
jgi:hypothetical protein